jgi:membrane protein implicated in regulation of membrane protease activity
METVYFYCAAIGGCVLVVQTLLLLFGIDGGESDADVSHADIPDGDVEPHPGDAFFKVLSIKTLTAFVTFFGLAGLAADNAGLGFELTLVISVGAGSVALYLVATLMSSLARLQSKGNVNIENAVGSTASVYLRIPANHQGTGKVTVEIQGRSLQFKAVTSGPELRTGAEVRVVRTTTPDTLEVVSIEE